MSTEAPAPAPLLSPAIASALAGGLLVGVTVAVIGVGFLGPALDAGFGAGSIFLLFVIGSVFGVVAGAVAGADSDGHEAPKTERTPSRTRTPQPGMTPLHRGV